MKYTGTVWLLTVMFVVNEAGGFCAKVGKQFRELGDEDVFHEFRVVSAHCVTLSR